MIKNIFFKDILIIKDTLIKAHFLFDIVLLFFWILLNVGMRWNEMSSFLFFVNLFFGLFCSCSKKLNSN